MAIIAFLVSLLIAFSTVAVYAATATSIWGYYGPYFGYSYQNQAKVSNESTLWASALVQNQQFDNVPTGYMGTYPRLFKSDGYLCADGEWWYNNQPSVGLETFAYGNCGSGAYYSQGYTAAYNADGDDGYDIYSTYRSPNINN
ncbi:MAG: hypothetical protein ACYC4L_21675 [Chloroflexota bacterium]